MNHLLKKILALSLCISMSFNIYISKSQASYQDIDTYALDVVGDMLYINGYNISDNISISNSYTVYNIDNTQSDKKIYFVLKNTELIALLVVENINNEYYASLELNVPDEIVNAYSSGSPFALYNYQNYLIIHTETQNIIANNAYFESIDTNIIDYSDIPLQSISKMFCNVMSVKNENNTILQPYNTTSKYGAYTVDALCVPYVAQQTAATGVELCWAACVASISNYLKKYLIFC